MKQGEVFTQLDAAEKLTNGLAELVHELLARLNPITVPREPQPIMGELRESKVKRAIAQRISEHNDVLRALQDQLHVQAELLEI